MPQNKIAIMPERNGRIYFQDRKIVKQISLKILLHVQNSVFTTEDKLRKQKTSIQKRQNVRKSERPKDEE
jgi:hypothetical protein